MTNPKLLAPYPIPVSDCFTGIVYGPGGSGRISMLIRIARAAGEKVTYFGEGSHEIWLKRLKKLHLHRNFGVAMGYHRSSSIEDAICRVKPRLVVIDPMPDGVWETLMRLAKDRSLGVLAALPPRKSKTVADMAHSADLVIRVDGMHWKVEKNRFGALSEGKVA